MCQDSDTYGTVYKNFEVVTHPEVNTFFYFIVIEMYCTHMVYDIPDGSRLITFGQSLNPLRTAFNGRPNTHAGQANEGDTTSGTAPTVGFNTLQLSGVYAAYYAGGTRHPRDVWPIEKLQALYLRLLLSSLGPALNEAFSVEELVCRRTFKSLEMVDIHRLAGTPCPVR